MHKLYKSFLSLCFVFLLFPVAGFSTHIVGGSLTYVWNGGISYTVTLKLYRDCASGTAAYSVNEKVAKKTTIEDFLVIAKTSVSINKKYL